MTTAPFRSPLPAPHAPFAPVAAAMRDTAADPARTAIVDAAGGARLSRGQLAARSAALAAVLRRRGIERGEPVAVAMRNAVSWPVVALGIWRAGAVLTPLNPYWGADETARLLALVAPRLAIADPDVAPMLRDAATTAGLATEVIGPATPLEPATGAAPRLTCGDLAAIVFSSGTSGLFKGVRLTHGNLAASAAQVAASFALDGAYDARSVALAGVPFFSAMGLGTALCAPLGVGARIVIVPAPRTRPILAAVATHGASHAVVPLTVVEEIAAAPSGPAHDLSSLRLLATGGAPVPPGIQVRASERVGCPARSGYGMTEATSMISGPQARPNDPETVGWLAAGTEARIVDPAHGGDAAPGDAGEVWIRGPQVMAG